MNCRACFTRINLTLMLLLSVFVACSAHAATPLDKLSFKDPALAQCIKTAATKNNWQKIADIKKLQCHGMQIRHLDGLAALSALEHLSLYNNDIKNTDLTALTRLNYINIANNQLQSVKLAGLTRLHTLYLFKNKLTTVDFGGLGQLKKLRITNNQLLKLDISPLKSLQKAYFFDNKLTDLVLTGLPKLKFVEVRQNPMPDEVYDRYDALEGITIVHDGNADDWK